MNDPQPHDRKGFSFPRNNPYRLFQLAGITIRVEWDFPYQNILFSKNIETFSIREAGRDVSTLRHVAGLPADIDDTTLGAEVYSKQPWRIFNNNGKWCYKGVLPTNNGKSSLFLFAFFENRHTKATIYTPHARLNETLRNGFESLALFPTDQVWLTHVLADRDALLLHSAAAIINGYGILFVGHSGAGKSTIIRLLQEAQIRESLDVEVLCDDRNIIRKWDSGWHVHGTWSHGDVPEVSPRGAPIKAIFFLNQAATNSIQPLSGRREALQLLLATTIRSVSFPETIEKNFELLERILEENFFHTLHFDRDGAIVHHLLKCLSS
jgi:hypothetical protein